MRAILDFHVEPSLPQPLIKLREIAYNMWWCWNPDSIDMFRRLDEQLWETTNHNPVKMLGAISQEKLAAMAEDQSYLEFLGRVYNDFKEYMSAETWFSERYGKQDAPFIAYFSMEFGLSECLPIYSGGLGVLSGDHIKSSSDLGIPLVGVTLAFQQGYFEQYLNLDGWQQERYPVNDFYNLPITLIKKDDGEPLRVYLDFPGRKVGIQVWKCNIGRVTLYLLDTNIPENSHDDQNITDQLYGGDKEMRIQQEIVLGIGGIRVLTALGIFPQVCHINEGHAAFLSLERIRCLVQKENLNFREARVATGGGNLFTTHTPVPAGFDIFSNKMMENYFGEYIKEMGMNIEDLLKMGRAVVDTDSEPFNMAIMALANATFVNGVSKLHGAVSRKMAAKGFRDIPMNEIPIEHITNGIHIRSWISKDMAGLLDRYLGSAWITKTFDPDSWKTVENIPDSELWRTHERRRERLVSFTRGHLKAQLRGRGASPETLSRADEVLNPEALTIGFARRFATYKRATLLLMDPERFYKILVDNEHPIQFIFAGKAHPHDEAGKEFIKEIIHFARDERVRDRIVFLENYNISLSRYLVQGVDVWLNTPRRPMEASGTSGMKVAANGGLNLSILDGWWAEGYNPETGWAIGAGEEYKDSKYQDEVESNALFDLLEKSVIPLFYQRGRDQLPRGWIRKMKGSMSQLAPFFNTDRMLIEYTEKYYMRAKAHFGNLSQNNFEGAKNLTQWKLNMLHNWSKVQIEAVNTEGDDTTPLEVGDALVAQAAVNLGVLRPEDVTLEMYVGMLDEHRRIQDGASVPMEVFEELGNGRFLFKGKYSANSAGFYGLGVRLIPFHPDLATKYEMALIMWA